MRLRPGNPPQPGEGRQLFAEKFFDENRYRLGKVGRFRLNRKFDQTVDENEMTLRPEDFLNTMKYMLALRSGEGEVDDIDHLGNRRLRTIDELAADEMRKGFLKLRRTVQERMSIKDPRRKPRRIAELVNSKSISSSIEFFFGRGELSQVVDQTNPLSQLTHERRLSALGPGGLNRKRAGFEVRDVHISHYGRICPIETPEGTNIGLIASLAIFTTVDEYGFLITPYRKVKNGKVTGEVAYLRADEEMKAVLRPAQRQSSPRPQGDRGGSGAGPQGGRPGPGRTSEEVKYIDISPKQIVGVSAALIPFLEHDDANRALMGSNMQRQAVPLLKTEPPMVGTGMEEVVGSNCSMVVKAEHAGMVTAVDATHIVINRHGRVPPATSSWGSTSALPEPEARGQARAEGQGRPDHRRRRRHLPTAIWPWARTCSSAFMTFDGYNFEDAILISERLVKNDSFTSIHIDEFDVGSPRDQAGPRGVHAGHPERQREGAAQPRRARRRPRGHARRPRRHPGRQGRSPRARAS